MEEILEIIKAVNRLGEKVDKANNKIDVLVDALSSSSSRELTHQYVDEDTACGIIHRCPSVLLKLRKAGELAFLRIGKKVLYKTEDLKAYLEKNYNTKQH